MSGRGASASPWRFLTALDAANPGDQELLKATRGDELELLQNVILSSKTTVLYAFSGNGKSSLISAGIIPTFRRSGYAVFRTRPRPALSLVSPSQAFKDCILNEFWLPQQNRIEAVVANAQAALAETAPEIRSILDPLLIKVNEILASGQGSDFQANQFRRHFEERSSLPLPEFVEEINNWLGQDMHLLFVLDQFEELFVHFYNTPEMAGFIADLGLLYASPHLKASFLFSMREDWVGSMVELQREVPSILGNCFKLEPMRVSQAAVALHETTKRVGASFEPGVAERILRDLSNFYRVLQKQSFAALRLTPSRMADPYIELPALQVLMEHLWNVTDPTSELGMCITLNRYLKTAPAGTENPAGYFLDEYLQEFLDGLPQTTRTKEKGVEKPDEWKSLRLDLLYLLTDRFAHRRAVSGSALLAEAREIRKADVTMIESPQLELANIESALSPLIAARLIYSAQGLGRVCHYELAHDFLVRAVVKLWLRLAERRAEDRFRYVESQEQSRARLQGLTGLALRVRRLMIGESALTVLSVSMLPVVWLISGTFPDVAVFACALIFPLMLALSGLMLGCWPAAIQGLISGAGIIITDGYRESIDWTAPDYASGYMMHVVVITVYLATGAASWAANLSETNTKLPWKKIAATSFDYAFILTLAASSYYLRGYPFEGSLFHSKIADARKLVPLALWLASQSAIILRRKASIGNVLFGLQRVSEGSSTLLVWLREAIGQATLLLFAIANWACWAHLDGSHGANRLFVFMHLLFLGGFIWVTFRKQASEQFVGRWSKTRVVSREDYPQTVTNPPIKAVVARIEVPRSAHVDASTSQA